MIKIVVDAMGGDNGPTPNVEGAVMACRKYPVEILLVGPKSVVERELLRFSEKDKARVSIVHASESIGMSESPSKAFRKKKDSSIHVGLNQVKTKKAEGFVSAGNTGAVMTASTLILGRAHDVERPGLAAVLPSKTNPYVILDLGSTVDCKPQHLVEFAIMGHYFAKLILKREEPKIGLLNIGEEKDKGNSLTLATYPLLEQLPLNFIGHIEAKEMTLGTTDVVVCDGFVGNNILKFGEGVSKLFSGFFKEEAKQSLLSKIALLLLRPAFKRFKKQYDYDEYGGGLLLGVNGISIVAHGSAGPVAIKNAIKVAYLSCQNRIAEKIADGIAEHKKRAPISI